MHLASRAIDAERERIVRVAEQWAEDATIAQLIARLEAVKLSADTPHVPADWRERSAAAEPSPNRAGDD